MSRIKNKQSGFTLIETFVAITVLTITVLGPMSLLSKALKDSIYIRDAITANFLAQEGVEMMIDKRNNGELSCGGEAIENCSLKLDHGSGYNCLSGEETKFHREIKVEEIDENHCKITSTVSGPNLPGGKIVSSSYVFK